MSGDKLTEKKQCEAQKPNATTTSQYRYQNVTGLLSMEETSLDWVDKATARRLLGIKDSQLRVDTKILLEIETPGFDYQVRRDRGFSRTTFQALVEFRKLVKSKGRTRAIAEINRTMESLHCERER